MSTQELTAALARLTTAEQEELLRLLEHHERLEAEQVVDARPGLEELFAKYRDLFPDPANPQRWRDEEAERSLDPEAYKLAYDAHERAYWRHYQALLASRKAARLKQTPPPSDVEELWAQYADLFPEMIVHEDKSDYLANQHRSTARIAQPSKPVDLCRQAKDLARADGFPPPEEVVPMKAPPPKPEAEPDPLDAMKRAAMRHASLPRSVRQDIEDSRVVHAESATYESIRAEQQRAPSVSAPDAPSATDKLDGFRGVGPLDWLVPGEDS